MISQQDLLDAEPKEFRWYGQHLCFQGHYLIQILIECDKIGKALNYIALFTEHTYLPFNLHQRTKASDFKSAKKLAKQILLQSLLQLRNDSNA